MDVRGIGINHKTCVRCSAWKGELGLEPTPDDFIQHLADVFDEIKRVLRKDGTCWINLGDTYSGSGRGIGSDSDPKWPKARNDERKHKQDWNTVSLQAKNLMLIPSRFAIEMQNRGWILRNDIIWQKPNPMPSSVKDRLTNSYEHLFFFVKSQRYWYDSDAIRESHSPETFARMNRGVSENNKWNEGAPGSTAHTMSRPRLHKNLRTHLGKKAHSMHEQRAETGIEPELNPAGRNALDVWSIATEPLPDEHYAAYPQKLCERPIKAGCPAEVCVECSKPKERITEYGDRIETGGKRKKPTPGIGDLNVNTGYRPTKTIGWTKCNCVNITCIKCEQSIPYGSKKHKEIVDAICKPGKKEGIPERMVEKKGQGLEQKISETRLSDMREGILREEESDNLQPKMCNPASYSEGDSQHIPKGGISRKDMELEGRRDKNKFGIYLQKSLHQTPPQEQERIRLETSTRNGEEDKQIFDAVRARSSQKREKERQQNRESGNSGNNTTSGRDYLSTLQQENQCEIECPKCGGNTYKFTHKEFEPGIVLDPFVGSGTTLLVARRLGRKSIGVDLKYQEIALRRLNVNQQSLDI